MEAVAATTPLTGAQKKELALAGNLFFISGEKLSFEILSSTVGKENPYTLDTYGKYHGSVKNIDNKGFTAWTTYINKIVTTRVEWKDCEFLDTPLPEGGQ